MTKKQLQECLKGAIKEAYKRLKEEGPSAQGISQPWQKTIVDDNDEGVPQDEPSKQNTTDISKY